MDEEPIQDLRGAVLKGATWSVALRWAIRLLGLASTAILARLLTPADFGLVAMGMLVVGFVEAWFSFGVDMALIQNQAATREHYDTAWTLRTIQSVAVAGLIAAAAPLAAAYFDEPRVTPVLWVLCPAIVVRGMANIGTVDFKKELRFHKEFHLQTISKLLGFLITVGTALWLRTYWALVIGTVAYFGSGCALSYAMHPYRPRFSLVRIRELWSFSQWVFVQGVGHFVGTRADEVLVAGLGSPHKLGLYTVAVEIGSMPGSEVAAPLNQALFPGFSKLQHDPHRLAAAYLNVLGTVSAVTFPAGVGLALVANETVLVLLGEKWIDAAPLLALLAIFGSLRATNSLAGSLLLGSGRASAAAGAAWLNAALLLAIALPLIDRYGAEGVAAAKLAGSVLLTGLIFVWVARITEARIAHVVARLWRTLAASALMAIAIASIPESGGGVASNLLVKVLVGMVSYGAALLLFWRLSGYPDGAERFLLDSLRRLVGRK